MNLWTSGNTAKLHCLNEIARLAQERKEPLSILDLGCGKGLNFVRLLQSYPSLRYVGLDPDLESCRHARTNLDGMNAVIHHGAAYSAYETVHELFDVIVSFSVFEHVYRRAEYLRALRACLKAEGCAFINYDAGHFMSPVGESFTMRDSVKGLARTFLASLSEERYYHAFVREQDFRRWVADAGLMVREANSFNLYSLKSAYKLLPEAQRPSYMLRWLQFEQEFNEAGIDYTDAAAKVFGTRNFILAHA